jgi:hypothetical protein
MTAFRLTIFISGLAALVTPAKASLTFQNSQTNWTNQVTTDTLTASSVITFTSADLLNDGHTCLNSQLCNDEYLDSTDGVELLALNSGGTGHDLFTLSGGTLKINNGDAIEVIFLTDIAGFAFDFTTTKSSGDTACIDLSLPGSGCASGGTFVANGGSAFLGTINDNPTPAIDLPTIFIHSLSGSANTNLQDYETAFTATVDSSAPDAGTMLTLGTGLILIALKRRRRATP